MFQCDVDYPVQEGRTARLFFQTMSDSSKAATATRHKKGGGGGVRRGGQGIKRRGSN